MIFEPSDEELTVTLLVLPDCSLMSLAATLDPMRGANRVTGRSLYRWRVVSPDGSDPVTSSGLSFGGRKIRGWRAGHPHHRQRLSRIGTCDAEASRHAAAGCQAIEAHRGCGSRIMGPGKGRIAQRPQGNHALGRPGSIFAALSRSRNAIGSLGAGWGTSDDRGAAPALDMMLALIRARHGYSIALDVASLYVYDEVKQASDAQPLVSLGRLLNREPRLADAIKIMETHIDRPIPVSSVARRLGLSTRSLELLFANVIGQSPGNYYLSLRLKAARRLILDTRLSMADTAEQTGFSSISSLSRAFKRHFGQSPSKLRQ